MSYKLSFTVYISLLLVVVFLSLIRFAHADYLSESLEHYVIEIPQDYSSTVLPIDFDFLVANILTNSTEFIQDDPFSRQLHAQLQLQKRRDAKKLLKRVDDTLEHLQAQNSQVTEEKNDSERSPEQANNEEPIDLADALEALKRKVEKDEKALDSPDEEGDLPETDIAEVPLKEISNAVLMGAVDGRPAMQTTYGQPHKERNIATSISRQSMLTVLPAVVSASWSESQYVPVFKATFSTTPGNQPQLYFEESKMQTNSARQVVFVSTKTVYAEEISWPWFIKWIINVYSFVAHHIIISLLAVLLFLLLFKIRHS